MKDVLLNTNELAEKLAVSKQTIFRWKREGMPTKVLGPQTFRYDYQEVEKWLTSRNQK